MAAKRRDLPAMLERMERVLERALAAAEKALKEAGEAETGPAAAKTYADLMGQIVRTVEKIHELKRAFAVETEVAGAGALDRAEREALRLRVERWIDERARERAERMLVDRAEEALRRRAIAGPSSGAGFDGRTRDSDQASDREELAAAER